MGIYSIQIILKNSNNKIKIYYNIKQGGTFMIELAYNMCEFFKFGGFLATVIFCAILVIKLIRKLIFKKETKFVKVSSLLVLSMVLCAIGIWNSWYNLEIIPRGSVVEYIESPNNEYTLITSIINGGVFSNDYILAEIEYKDTGKIKNIYYSYPGAYEEAEWIDEHTVKLDEMVIDVESDQTYDFRNE